MPWLLGLSGTSKSIRPSLLLLYTCRAVCLLQMACMRDLQSALLSPIRCLQDVGQDTVSRVSICTFCSAISGDMNSPMDKTLQQLQSNAGTRKFGHVMYSDDAPLLEGVPAADSPDAVFTQGRGVLVSMLWGTHCSDLRTCLLGQCPQRQPEESA